VEELGAGSGAEYFGSLTELSFEVLQVSIQAALGAAQVHVSTVLCVEPRDEGFVAQRREPIDAGSAPSADELDRLRRRPAHLHQSAGDHNAGSIETLGAVHEYLTARTD